MGLSNIAVLLALYYYGFPEALCVSWLRVLVGSLFTGTLFTPAFAFGMTGGLFAAAAMALALRWSNKLFSPVGISVIGASFHSLGQLTAAYLLFISHSAVWHLLPYMILTSVLTGGVVGFISIEVLERTMKNAQ